MDTITLRPYKARKSGIRGLTVTLPAEYVRLNNITSSDEIKTYLVKDNPTILILQIKKGDKQKGASH